MGVVIFALLLAIVLQWMTERGRHKSQTCGICPSRIKWVGLGRSPSGWTHADGQLQKPFPGLDRIPGLLHYAVGSEISGWDDTLDS